MCDLKNRSILVTNEAGNGAVAVTMICFHISVLCCHNNYQQVAIYLFCIIVLFSLVYWNYLCQWKKPSSETDSTGVYYTKFQSKFQETATARAEAKLNTHVV